MIKNKLDRLVRGAVSIGVQSVVLVVATGVFAIQPVLAVPAEINYQGYLTDPSGAPVNTTVNITFRIYDVETGGTDLWNETDSVVISDGKFTTPLGDDMAFPAGLFDNASLYLGIEIETDGEMSPRKALTTAPFAFKAEDANTLEGMSASEFVGTGGGQSIAGDVTINGEVYASDLTIDGNTNVVDLIMSGGGALVFQDGSFQTTNSVNSILAADGTGSTLDADLVDGMQASEIIDAASDEVRTPISESDLPLTISTSGSYYFTEDLSHSGTSTNAITITADDVTIDFVGFTLSGPGNASGANDGVQINGASNVTIRNGTIREFGDEGIHNVTVTQGHIVENMKVLNNGDSGILLVGDNHTVRDCVVLDSTNYGVFINTGALLTGNTVANNGLEGVYVSAQARLSNNTIYNNGGGNIFLGQGSVEDKADVRTPISQADVPLVINQKGSYYFTENISFAATNADAIRIVVPATVDMMGFTLTGPGSGTGSGIYVPQFVSYVNIRNGTIEDFGANGILADGTINTGTQMIEVSNVTVASNGDDGIFLKGYNHVITGCKARNNGDIGIYAEYSSLLTNNTAMGNAGAGILGGNGSTLSKNIAYDNAGVYGIFGGVGSIIVDNVAYENTGSYGIYGNGGANISNNSAYSNQGAGINGFGSNVVTNNTSRSNTGDGIVAGTSSVISGNSAYANSGLYGISGGLGSVISENAAYQNAQWGIHGAGGNRIMGNTANFNNQNDLNDVCGILIRTDSRVMDNLAHGNRYCNIYVSSSGNMLENNHVTGAQFWSASNFSGYGIEFDSTDNFFRNNTATNNANVEQYRRPPSASRNINNVAW